MSNGAKGFLEYLEDEEPIVVSKVSNVRKTSVVEEKMDNKEKKKGLFGFHKKTISSKTQFLLFFLI